MEQYIKKSALVEWIKKEDKEMQPNKDWHFDEYTEGYVDALAKILSFIDTLEVKEVDLEEKACDAYCKVCGHYAHSVPTHICRHDCRYFSDFKKYMKGE
jgi:hypothetical protein